MSRRIDQNKTPDPLPGEVIESFLKVGIPIVLLFSISLKRRYQHKRPKIQPSSRPVSSQADCFCNSSGSESHGRVA